MKKITDKNKTDSNSRKAVLKRAISISVAALIVFALTACSPAVKTTVSNVVDFTAVTDNVETETLAVNSADTAVTVSYGDFGITTDDGSVDVSGNTYTITAAGTYVVSGTLENGQIVIDAGEEDEVELILNGMSITCSYDSPIYAKSAGKLKIKAESGTTNIVTDSRTVKKDENDVTGSAAIYALCDMNIVGYGSLTVNAGYNNGVQTKDDLKIKNVTLTVTAPNNAIKGNDSITIESGTVNAVSTAGDGLETENYDISSKGNQRGIITISGGTVNIRSAKDGIHAAYDVKISGGTVTVTAGDDGIHAENTLQIDGGYVNVVNSHEGLEGHYVTVNDGEIHVYATDDGVNATSSSGSRVSDGLITVNGGIMIVEVGGRDVDGIDANGSYKQTGGIVIVSNPNADSSGNTASVDSDGSVTVTGGIIVALGTVPGGAGGAGGGRGGRFGMGGMNAGSTLPSGYVTFSGSLSAGDHTFTYGDTSISFTLKSKVSSGWIWASGISTGSYTLK